MKVLTVKSEETIPSDIQRDIHYALRMEHHTDYVFKDEDAAQYAATISLQDPVPVIRQIIEHSVEVSDYTIIIHCLDMDANQAERLTIRNGEILKKQEGSWEWNV
ncbi:hypothetical protein ACFLT1_02865 [Bacteroidota bacterium]